MVGIPKRGKGLPCYKKCSSQKVELWENKAGCEKAETVFRLEQVGRETEELRGAEY